MHKNTLTEKRNPRTADIDLMDTTDIVKAINNEDLKIAKAVQKTLPEIATAVDIISSALLNGGRLAYFGAGTSGRLGILDAVECMPTFSVPQETIRAFIAGGTKAMYQAVENAEDNGTFALEDINTFAPTAKDIVVGISASGNPTYILTVLQEARRHGAKTIGITCNPDAKLTPLCDVSITAVVGPEVITGSSRMKAGTAQKMILNMLSTASMIKIGKTYGNYMIDVTPTCTKLIDRGNRIISAICGIPVTQATEYRIKADNNIKTACVMCLKQCSKPEAEQLLWQHHGILRKVIQT